ncbi:hypothetical protein B9T31_10560 [Acinetobacter sp. ANC 4558]|uniref:Rrf2 family transcriptional regulator n=1 Tax=Acinetobacter sp. ANC 4558 TaxID=1977876 RepID=UPI000A34770D|nr:Rrf2 family transcriptional regulator [Acinetobacter sp. ANC 4558]OTG85600.1 hypothetical protein B9T31_10560 [Acinetobacter sp. ANC 4558]
MHLDTKFSRLLHVLIHMQLRGGSTTSETIAQMLHTNPALVRRTMAPLRRAGYIKSERGPGGGWTLCCKLSEVTAKDIYIALDYKGLFALGLSNDHPDCPVERSVNHLLSNAMQNAETEFIKTLENVHLSTLADHIQTRENLTNAQK